MSEVEVNEIILKINKYEARIISIALDEWCDVHNDVNESHIMDTTPIELKKISDEIKRFL